MLNKSLRFYLLSFVILATVFAVFWRLHFSHPSAGTWTCVSGRWLPTGNPADPMPSETCAESAGIDSDGNSTGTIRILSPSAGSTSSLPMILSVSAPDNSGSLNYELASSGSVILRGDLSHGITYSSDSHALLDHADSYPSSSNASLVLFRTDSSSRSRNVLATVNFKLLYADLKPLKIYFSKNSTSSDGKKSCGVAFPVERWVPDLPGFGGRSLHLLLSGLSEEEFNRGYRTDLPPETKLNSLVITDGLAVADFDKEVLRGENDECRLANMESQIKSTLLALPDVVRAELTVNGKPWNAQSK